MTAPDPPSSLEAAVLRAELRWLRSRLDDLAGAVGHDLRGPLAVIAGHAELLGGGVMAAAQVPRSAEALRRQADRLGGMLDEIHARLRCFAALDEGGLPTGGEQCDGAGGAEDAVRGGVALLDALASRRGVGVEVKFEGVGLAGSPRGLRVATALLLEACLVRARRGETIVVEGAASDGRVRVDLRPGGGVAEAGAVVGDPRVVGAELVRAAADLAVALGGRLEASAVGPMRLVLPDGGGPPVRFVGPDAERRRLAAWLGLVPAVETEGGTPVVEVVTPARAADRMAGSTPPGVWEVVVPADTEGVGGPRRWVVPELAGGPALRAAVQDARRAASVGEARRDPTTGLRYAWVAREEVLARASAAARVGRPVPVLLLVLDNADELRATHGPDAIPSAIRWIRSLIQVECGVVPDPLLTADGALLVEGLGWAGSDGAACASRLEAAAASGRPRFGSLRAQVRLRAFARDASSLEDRDWLALRLARGERGRE